MPAPDPGLHDRQRARIAWARWLRLMRWMVVLALVAVVAALGYLGWGGGTVTVTVVIATALGVGGTVLLGTGLMLLAFMSNGSGHDAAAGERPPRPPR